MCARKTLVEFPLRVRSPARGRRGSLAALPRRDTHTGTKTCRGSTRYRHPTNGRAIRRSPAFTSGFDALRAGRGSEFHPARGIPKRKTTQRVVFLFVITLRFCCSHPRISQGRGSVRGKPLRVSPLAFNPPPAGDRFCCAKSPLQKNTTTQRVVVFFWSGRRGSNSLPRPWQGRALPDELRPQTQDRLYLSSQRLSTPFSQFPQKTSCPPLRAGMPAFTA